jgi:hypothetical protein
MRSRRRTYHGSTPRRATRFAMSMWGRVAASKHPQKTSTRRRTISAGGSAAAARDGSVPRGEAELCAGHSRRRRASASASSAHRGCTDACSTSQRLLGGTCRCRARSLVAAVDPTVSLGARGSRHSSRLEWSRGPMTSCQLQRSGFSNSMDNQAVWSVCNLLPPTLLPTKYKEERVPPHAACVHVTLV